MYCRCFPLWHRMSVRISGSGRGKESRLPNKEGYVLAGRSSRFRRISDKSACSGAGRRSTEGRRHSCVICQRHHFTGRWGSGRRIPDKGQGMWFRKEQKITVHGQCHLDKLPPFHGRIFLWRNLKTLFHRGV